MKKYLNSFCCTVSAGNLALEQRTRKEIEKKKDFEEEKKTVRNGHNFAALFHQEVKIMYDFSVYDLKR